MPRLGDVTDLGKAVAKVSGVEASLLTFAHVQKGRCARLLADEAVLVSHETASATRCRLIDALLHITAVHALPHHPQVNV